MSRGAARISLMALLALAALSCGGGGQQTPTPPSTLGLKPTLHGLIDRNGPPPPEWLGQMGGFVVNAFWSDLQPAENDPIAANNAIDSAIARAQGLEASGAHIGIKVRFYAGIDAPQWAKNLGGGPVTIYDPTAGRGGTVGRFWTPQFGAAYDAVWQQLATKYDSVPEIRQIEVDRCGTVFTESLVRDTADPQTVQSLLAAGFTVAADQLCIQDELAQGQVWQSTRIGFELNPYKRINPDGTVSNDEALTGQMMDYCRQQLGLQCVLENDSIRWPPLAGEMGKVYAKMQALGPPIAFQTAILSRVGNLIETLTWAQLLGADSVELPREYVNYPPTAFQPLAASLATNPG